MTIILIPLLLLNRMPSLNNSCPLLRRRSAHLFDPLRNACCNDMLPRATRQRLAQVFVNAVEGVTG